MTLGVYTDRPLPELPKRVVPEWATWIDLRGTGEFKLHQKLGHAKNAITSAGHGLLYRWMDEQWTCVAIVNKGQARTHPALRAGVIPNAPAVQYVISEVP